jgi:hypothetical protein
MMDGPKLHFWLASTQPAKDIEMGDAADDAIDRGMDEWLSGEYDDSGDCGAYVLRSKTCRNCGAVDLQWGLSKGKWKLFDAAGLHVCPMAKAAKKVFK